MGQERQTSIKVYQSDKLVSNLSAIHSSQTSPIKMRLTTRAPAYSGGCNSPFQFLPTTRPSVWTLCCLHEQFCHLLKTLFAEIDLGQRIFTVAVKAGGDQEHFGFELVKSRQYAGMEGGEIFFVAGATPHVEVDDIATTPFCRRTRCPGSRCAGPGGG